MKKNFKVHGKFKCLKIEKKGALLFLFVFEAGVATPCSMSDFPSLTRD